MHSDNRKNYFLFHQMLYLGRPGQSNSAAPNISCQEDTQIMPEEEDDDWDSDSDVSADDAYASSWSARISFNPEPEQDSFCTTQGLPSKILDTTWSASCLDISRVIAKPQVHRPVTVQCLWCSLNPKEFRQRLGGWKFCLNLGKRLTGVPKEKRKNKENKQAKKGKTASYPPSQFRSPGQLS